MKAIAVNLTYLGGRVKAMTLTKRKLSYRQECDNVNPELGRQRFVESCIGRNCYQSIHPCSILFRLSARRLPDEKDEENEFPPPFCHNPLCPVLFHLPEQVFVQCKGGWRLVACMPYCNACDSGQRFPLFIQLCLCLFPRGLSVPLRLLTFYRATTGFVALSKIGFHRRKVSHIACLIAHD